jgi:hypothetical protein
MDRLSSESKESITSTLSALRELHFGSHGRQSQRQLLPSNLDRFEAASRSAFAGFGVALKQRGGDVTNEVAVRIYMRRKLSRRRLRSLGTLPTRAEFGASLPPVAIDVVELPDRPQLHTACTAGAGIAADSAKGTLGAVVVDSRGVQFGLTCAHVVAPWAAKNPFGRLVTLSVPGTDESVALGTVEDWTRFSSLDHNTADAALVRLGAGVVVDNALGAAPTIDDSPIDQLDLLHDTSVRIRTRRGEIAGLIDSVKNDLDFGFAGRNFSFSNIVAYRASVMSGDSGSSVILGADRLLGLHFAGQGAIGPGYCVTGRKILQAFPLRQLRLV